jgi:hypothetical protein
MSWLLRAVSRPGSTRHLALLRWGLVAAAWSEWAYVRLLYKAETWVELLVSVAFFAGTAMAFVGWFTRAGMFLAGGAAMALVYGYGLFGDVDIYWHHHSKVLAHALFLSALLPLGNSWSVDRWLAVRRAGLRGEPAPSADGDLWATRLVCVAEAVVWFWGAVDKLEWRFLSGDRMLQIIFGYYSMMADLAPYLAPVLAVSSIATVALEFALPLGMWFRRFRPYLLPCAVLLHSAFYVILPVGSFSATMIVMLLAWVDPEEADAVWARLEGAPPAA